MTEQEREIIDRFLQSGQFSCYGEPVHSVADCERAKERNLKWSERERAIDAMFRDYPKAEGTRVQIIRAVRELAAEGKTEAVLTDLEFIRYFHWLRVICEEMENTK